MKTLAYRLTGRGKITGPLRAALEREGLEVLDEGIRGSITRRNYGNPARGHFCSWQCRWFTGAVAVTPTRVVACGPRSNPVVNVPLTDDRIRKMRFEEEEPGLLLMAFDAALFRPVCSGTMEYRFCTPQAGAFLEALRRRGLSGIPDWSQTGPEGPAQG